MTILEGLALIGGAWLVTRFLQRRWHDRQYRAFLADRKAPQTVARWNGYVEEHDEGD